jgi:peptide-methionine (R)-S-oxide reductase
MSTFRKTPEAIARLSPEQYRVTQQSGTEAPGTGELLDNYEPGIYVDIVSGEPLFASSAKRGGPTQSDSFSGFLSGCPAG